MNHDTTTDQRGLRPSVAETVHIPVASACAPRGFVKAHREVNSARLGLNLVNHLVNPLAGFAAHRSEPKPAHPARSLVPSKNELPTPTKL